MSLILQIALHKIARWLLLASLSLAKCEMSLISLIALQKLAKWPLSAVSKPAKCRISPIPQIILHKTARWFSFLLFRQNAKCLSFLQIAIYENCKRSPFLQFLCTASSCSIRWFPASKKQNISNSANHPTQNSKMVFLLVVSAKCEVSLNSADCYL